MLLQIDLLGLEYKDLEWYQMEPPDGGPTQIQLLYTKELLKYLEIILKKTAISQ